MNIKFFHVGLLLFSLLSINEKINAQVPGWQWSKGITGNGDINSYSITHDLSGNVYTVGSFISSADFDPDSTSDFIMTSSGIVSTCFISKLDSAGKFVWAKEFAGVTSFSSSTGFSIALDAAGNIFTIGYFQDVVDFDPGPGTFNIDSGGTFICKLDNQGNFIWAKAIAGVGASVEGLSIAVDDSGNTFSTGNFIGTVDFDPGSAVYNLTSVGLPGNADIFILKTDSSGNFEWVKSIGGNGDDEGTSLTLDASGNIFCTGFFRDTVDFDPGAGTVNLISKGGYDIFISKLNKTGNLVWTKSIGDTSDDKSFSIAVDNDGNVLTTGFFSGTVDFDPGGGTADLISGGGQNIFISKLDASGNFSWAKEFSGTNDGSGKSVTTDVAGNVFTTGSYSGTTDFDPGLGTSYDTSAGYPDMYFSKLDDSGNLAWVKTAGGSSYDYGTSVSVDAVENVYVTGFFASPVIVFDSTAIVNADPQGNTYNVCIAKIKSKVNGIGEIKNGDNIILFPNPASSKFFIFLDGNYEKFSLMITDVSGKIIYETSCSGIRMKEINTIDYSAGLYFVKIKSDDFIVTKKIVIQE